MSADWPKLLAFHQTYDRIDHAKANEHWDVLLIDIRQDFNLPTKRKIKQLLKQKDQCYLFLHKGRKNEAHIKRGNKRAITELLDKNLEPFVPEFHHHHGELYDLLLELANAHQQRQEQRYTDGLNQIEELLLTLKEAEVQATKSQFLQYCMSIDNIRSLLRLNGGSDPQLPFPSTYAHHPAVQKTLRQLSELPADAHAEQHALLISLREMVHRDL
ncbi:MAG: hypothetical protein AAGG75_09860 [Bacteroidota bacterium]